METTAFFSLAPSLLGVLDGTGLIGSASDAGIALGAASAAIGAVATKVWYDREKQATASRLVEVQRQAALTFALALEPSELVRQLLEVLDWYFAAEEEQLQRQKPAIAVVGRLLGPELCSKLAGVEQLPPQIPNGIPDKDFKRQLRRIRRMCVRPPSSKGRRMPSLVSQSFKAPALGREEAYQRLFDPKWGSLHGNSGVAAALTYLVRAFLEVRRQPQGSLSDGGRASLRLAVSALAQHQIFTEPDEEIAPSISSRATGRAPDEEEPYSLPKLDQEREFRARALAVLCLLDGALSWRPVDPFGWSGRCEDVEGAALAKERGMCSFPHFASKLRKCLKHAFGGKQTAWRRLEVHLDAMRARELPVPWSWVWVQNEESSMIVRNWTKVPLRVELHKPKSSTVSPWADWPLLRYFTGSERKVIFVADVAPGIEWALRPRAADGREFTVRLLTTSGVTVCSRRLVRGESFDFEVNVPPPPPRRITLGTRGSIDEQPVHCDDAKDTEDHAGSVCSTAAPPSVRSSLMSTTSTRWGSVASTRSSYSHLASLSSAAKLSAQEQMQAKMAARRRIVESGSEAMDEEPKVEKAGKQFFSLKSKAIEMLDDTPLERRHDGSVSEPDNEIDPVASGGPTLLSLAENLREAICPRCLRNMPSRRRRPRASIYAGGVSCDRCSVEVISGENDSNSEVFFHCSRCWFDLCQGCAYSEMRDVWWDED